nr:shematrin-like protein 2 [Anolis sagrei ordinatus]
MSYYQPSCVAPSYDSTPLFGFGSSGCRVNGLGNGSLGYGGFGYGGLGYGGYGNGSGSVTSSADLGTLSGVTPNPINQLPTSECVINLSPVVVTIPGAILSSTCEPLLVDGNTPSAVGGYGLSGGPGSSSFSGRIGSGYLGGRKGFPGQYGNICP